MDKYISLKDFAPVINDKDKGFEILNKIKALDPRNNVVHIDMGDIVSMTTYCAKLIFGSLFKELGGLYDSNVLTESTSSDLDVIIELGLESAKNSFRHV